MASRFRRRRSKPKTRRVSKKRTKYTRKTKRFRKARPLGTSKQKYPNYYGDVAISKLKDHFITASTYNATDLTLSHAEANMQVIHMNANGNAGTLLSALGTPIATFEPLNFSSIEQRYAQARPMGMHVNFKITLPDNASTPNTPLVLAVFPYQTFGSQYGNYWNGTTTPDLGFNIDSVGQMKYGFVRRLYSSGSKPAMSFSKYYNFAKIVGRTREQYLSDTNFQYDTSVATAPAAPIKLACIISDLVSGTVRTYNVELFAKQYCRFEASKLTPF